MNAPVKHVNGALTNHTCPAPCYATVVFTSMGAGYGWNYDAGHRWLRAATLDIARRLQARVEGIP